MSEPSVSKYDLVKLASIAPCTPENCADLRELHKAAISSSGWRFYSLAEVAEKLRVIDDPDYTISLLNENTLLSSINDILVGTLSWRPSNEHPQTAVITTLYVHPLFTNGGIATDLIENAEQAAYNNGFRWISAHADFNSRTFFSKLGYESRGFRNCNADQLINYPLQVMTRHISSHYSSCAHHENTGVKKQPVREPVILD